MSGATASDRGKDETRRPSLAERFRALFGFGAPSVREDIEDALEEAKTSSEFSPQERMILKNVLALNELRVANVMVPRADIVAVDLDVSLAQVLSHFRTAGHSRLPVYHETLDDPRGMVHIRDFVDHVARAAEGSLPRRPHRQGPLSDDAPARDDALTRRASFAGVDLSQTLEQAGIIRPVLFAPPSMPALDLLVRMQASRTHMALVIDEYGGTDGLVSIEDLVEMIVGDIEDEHDVDERPSLQLSADGAVIADARADLQSVSKLIGRDLSGLAEGEGVETLGGLIAAVAGRLPARGEIVKLGQDLELEVLDADPRRIKRLKIVGPPSAGPSEKRQIDRSNDALSTDGPSPNQSTENRRDL